MSTKMTRAALKVREVYVQYSKRMCTAISIYWMAYRIVVSLLIFFKPSVSNALIHLTDGADTVMIANISVYAGNSICEKGFIAFGKRSKLYSSDDDEKEVEAEETKEETKEETDNG